MFAKQLTFLLAVGSITSLSAEDWPQFRGPRGDGHSMETRAPSAWSETENVIWRMPINGLGWSSPVILGDRIWLTTALDDGKSLRAISIDKANGKVLVDVEVFSMENPVTIHSKNSHASPTPILEPGRVYVHFGADGTACLDAGGKSLWKTTLKYAHGHGPAGSPVTHGDLLFITCDGTDMQYVVALNKADGQTRWKTNRMGRMAYSTPAVFNCEGKDQLVTTGGDAFVAYDPLTGHEIWRVRHQGFSLVPKPVFANGLLFLCSGYGHAAIHAVRPDGKGDVSSTHVAWVSQRGAPLNPSPLYLDGRLYIVSDNGVASALDPKTGETLWQERLGGDFSASPVYAAGRIYFLNENGVTTVIEPGEQPKKSSVNEVTGRTLASLAVSEGNIFLRTDKALYRIGSKADPK